jgi:hypothetical protein
MTQVDAASRSHVTREEEPRRIPGELLEQGNENGSNEQGAMLAAQQVTEGVRDAVGQRDCILDILKLGVNVLGTTDPFQHLVNKAKVFIHQAYHSFCPGFPIFALQNLVNKANVLNQQAQHEACRRVMQPLTTTSTDQQPGTELRGAQSSTRQSYWPQTNLHPSPAPREYKTKGGG